VCTAVKGESPKPWAALPLTLQVNTQMTAFWSFKLMLVASPGRCGMFLVTLLFWGPHYDFAPHNWFKC
jgi:hypothetical protein